MDNCLNLKSWNNEANRLGLNSVECKPQEYREYQVRVFISRLPGKAVDIVRLAELFNLCAFSKPSLVNLTSKDANLAFYLSAYQADSLFKLANMT